MVMTGDPHQWSDQQTYAYIFEPDPPPHGRIRWSWIDPCLLGDIRTMLVGMMAYTGGLQAIDGGLPLGGGNLSAPILVTTALELLGRLHSGATGSVASQGYNATSNVQQFITHHMSGTTAAAIALVLRHGIRNGLHHNFTPNAMQYADPSSGQTGTLAFTFTPGLTPHDTSIVGRLPDGSLHVWVAAGDMVNALQNAVDSLRAELQNDNSARVSFVQAWQWLESPPQQANANQQQEISGLLRQLAPGQGVRLFGSESYTISGNPAAPGSFIIAPDP